MTETTGLTLARKHHEAINIDELIGQALGLFSDLPSRYEAIKLEITDLRKRLSQGEIRLAVMGQFKRGKSTFINSLLNIDLLPVSVIPLTSIPTYIRYGAETSCIIRFYNKKHELVIRRSAEEIKNALIQFVSEEKNPKNKLCVSEAIIECDNPILSNGTILIDTPGFGSTFIHNTQTTVELIKGCDAVMFLLSADPPFTQTEVEFLKEVKKFVPRIFFIVNKVDQLTVDELKKLDPFLKSVLIAQLEYPPDVELFHVSARMGQSIVNRSANNPAMQLSGMSIVKSEIIDFMVREKYFTLSQAVTDKFKKALVTASAQCDSDILDLESPLASARQQLDWLTQQCDVVKAKAERELSLIDVEIKALVDFVDKTLDKKKEELIAKAQDSIKKLIETAILQGQNPLSTIKSSYGPLLDEMINHLFLQVTTSISQPLKKAVSLPASQFLKSVDEIRKAVPSFAIVSSDLRELSVDCTVPPYATVQTAHQAAALEAIRMPSFGLFSSKETKRLKCEAKILPALEAIMSEQFERLSFHVKNNIRSICDMCKQNLAYNFTALQETMARAMTDLLNTQTASEAPTREKIAFLQKHKEAFADIQNYLV